LAADLHSPAVAGTKEAKEQRMRFAVLVLLFIGHRWIQIHTDAGAYSGRLAFACGRFAYWPLRIETKPFFSSGRRKPCRSSLLEGTRLTKHTWEAQLTSNGDRTNKPNPHAPGASHLCPSVSISGNRSFTGVLIDVLIPSIPKQREEQPMSNDLNQTTESIIGCAYTVGNTLGHGFLEKVYENPLLRKRHKPSDESLDIGCSWQSIKSCLRS
jgi:hypothetical protein